MLRCRQEEIEAQFRAEYNDKFSSHKEANLHVMSISATPYLQWLHDDFRSEDPPLSPEETGVPQLRRTLSLVTADDNYNAIREHVDIALRGISDRASRILKKFQDEDEYVRLCKELINMHHPVLLSTIQNLFDNQIFPASPVFPPMRTAILDAIEDVVHMWFHHDGKKIPHRSVDKVLRDRGFVIKSKAKAYKNRVINYCQELLNVMLPDLEQYFTMWDSRVQNYSNLIEAAIEGFFNKVHEHIRTTTGNHGLKNSAEYEWQKVERAIRAKAQKLKIDMGNIVKRVRINSTAEFDFNGMIVCMNKKIFCQVSEFSGCGKQSRQESFLKARLTGRGNRRKALPDKVESKIQTQLSNQLPDLISCFVSGLENEFKDFARILDELPITNYTMSAPERDARHHLKHALPAYNQKLSELQHLLSRENSGMKRRASSSGPKSQASEPSKRQRITAEEG